MSIGQSFSRARSHIVFILALLSAAAYILWVERERGVGSWRVELGEYESGEEAGRQWDLLRSTPGLHAVQIVRTTDKSVRLEVREVSNEATARRICRIARAKRVECLVVSPLKAGASAT
ncbi:MAG TPA: hypothetical protein VGR19_11790 [Allosphingosinicella sp.]|nr:hypothetical protein [Allosphingosinicella sp.]